MNDDGTLSGDTNAADWSLRKRGASRGWVAALVFSTVLHLAVLGAVVRYVTGQQSGGGGQLLDAIEVEIIGGDALESTSANVGKAAGAAATSVDAGSRETVAVPPTVSVAKPAPQAASDLQPADATDADMIARARATLEPPTKIAPAHEAIVAAPEPVADTSVKPEAQASAAAVTAADVGGQTVTAEPATVASAAAAAASPGDIVRFNAAVRKALSSQRPKRGWPSGRVLIAFSVSEVGRVENAELVEASADSRLNKLTLAWITAVAMPTPPVGLAAVDRRYSLPLTVK